MSRKKTAAPYGSLMKQLDAIEHPNVHIEIGGGGGHGSHRDVTPKRDNGSSRSPSSSSEEDGYKIIRQPGVARQQPTLQQVSLQLDQILQFQNQLLQEKQTELQQLQSLVHSQQAQLERQQDEIQQIQRDRLQEQEQRALELQRLVRSGGGGGGHYNPYSGGSGDSIMDTCSNLFLLCDRGDSTSISTRRRRGGRPQSSASSSCRLMDIVHACFLIMFAWMQIRFFTFSNQSFTPNNHAVESSTYPTQNSDYSSYTPPPTRLKPWESTPPTPIALATSSSSSLPDFMIQRHTCIQGIRKRHKEELGNFLYQGQETDPNWRTILVDPAYHSNVGDHMLTLGELTFLKQVMQQPQTEQCHWMQAQEYFTHCNQVMDLPTPSNSHRPWALWHAGGNWGDLWWDVHGIRMASFEKYLQRNFTILGMPQSLFYKDRGLEERDVQRIRESTALGLGLAKKEYQEYEEEENNNGHGATGTTGGSDLPPNWDQQEEDAAIARRRRLDENMFEPPNEIEEGGGWYNGDDQFSFKPPKPVNTSRLDTEEGRQLAKSRVTFTWRERESYEQAQKLYPFVNNMVVPDMAFQLGPYQPIRKPSSSSKLVDILFLLREDHESTTQRGDDYIQGLLVNSNHAATTFRIVDWPSRLSIFDTRDEYFTDTAIELLSLGKIVVCDRLHAAILSYLAGMPFVYIDQVSGKVTNTLRVAFENLDDCANGEKSMWANAPTMDLAIAKALEMMKDHKLDHSIGGSGGGLRSFFGM